MQNFDLTILWSRKWTVLFLTVVAILCGAAYTLTAPPVYQSEAKLLVVRRHSATEVRKAADERYFLATQAEIMGSAKILTGAMEKLGRSIDEPIDELLEDVKVSPMDDTDVMSVTVRDEVPEQADALVGAIVETYSEYVRTVDEERSSESVAAIVRREKELSQELIEARAEHGRLRANSPLVGLDGDGIKIQMAQLQQLATDLATATNLRIDLDNQVAVARESGRAPVGRSDASAFRLTTSVRSATDNNNSFAGDLQTTHIMDDLRAAKNELTEYSRRYGENHPRAKAAVEKVSSLQRELRAHSARITEAVNQQLTAARSHERKLKAEYDSLMKSTKEMDQFIVEDSALTQRIQQLDETRQVLVTTLAQARLAESELSSGLGSIDVRTLDGPNRVVEKVWPRPSLVLGLAGILGLGLGCLLAICTEPKKS